MRTYAYRYPVKLSEEQRRFLETMVHTSRIPAKHYLVARVLLMSDQSQGQPEATDGQIAEALSISRRTVIRIKQRFVQENLEVALTGSFPRERPERRCLDGKGEAQLIHLACSQAPDGRQRWTLELLADRMVRLGYVEHISPETVRKTLKKTLNGNLALSYAHFAGMHEAMVSSHQGKIAIQQKTRTAFFSGITAPLEHVSSVQGLYGNESADVELHADSQPACLRVRHCVRSRGARSEPLKW
jgi:Homeodomain-like domain